MILLILLKVQKNCRRKHSTDLTRTRSEPHKPLRDVNMRENKHMGRVFTLENLLRCSYVSRLQLAEDFRFGSRSFFNS